MNCLKAFLVGGSICLVGQILIDFTKLTPARILVSFVVLGVFLSAVGVYGPLVDFAGAGATVPLSGFGHLLAQGAKKAVEEYGLIGALCGGMSAAATGISAAIFFGFIMSLIFKPGDRTK
ncbi:MAG: stage V sporulation protein AE [Acutalibacteraceae bacterium]|nr:stage V sporulation protein AE [Acutalibacteraceae bacterium]